MKPKLPIFSWALYDLSNQFFALNIVSLYFPRWITIEKGLPEIYYSVTFGLSMVFVALCAPFLGILSDIRNRRKVFLIVFTVLAVVFTAGLGISTNILVALLCFAVANFGCHEAIVFYNALLTDVAPEDRVGLISGIGRMFGYSGAILALYLTKPVVDAAGYQGGFFVTAILFLVFALPCMFFVRESRRREEAVRRSFREELAVMLQDFKKICDRAGFTNFLFATFFVVCALSPIMLFMAVYAGAVFDLSETAIINLIVFSTVFAIIGSFVSGYSSDRIGHLRAFMLVIILWGVCIIAAGTLSVPFHWLVGGIAGFTLGATWVVLRAVVIRLVPKENIGGAFALFNLVGYLAGIVGPLFWGITRLCLEGYGKLGYRVTLSGLIIFVVTGYVFFTKMKREVRANV